MTVRPSIWIPSTSVNAEWAEEPTWNSIHENWREEILEQAGYQTHLISEA